MEPTFFKKIVLIVLGQANVIFAMAAMKIAHIVKGQENVIVAGVVGLWRNNHVWA